MNAQTLVRVIFLSLFCAAAPAVFADGSIQIQKSKYLKGQGELQVAVKLSGFQGAQLVRLYGGDPPALLASANTKKNLVLKVRNFTTSNPPPCIVMVTVGDVSVQSMVDGAPDNCTQPEGLELAGVVRDAAIPGAAITVTVGGLLYTTVANENGEFFIEIVSLDLDALVLIESLGENPIDETQSVDMTSLAGTFSKLVEDADEDGIVDGTENPNINNTPYTTALFVLLVEANGGEPPATLEELQTAEKTVDATELVQLAAVIKLLVDDPDYELPIDPGTGEQYPSILAFLSDSEVDGDGNTPVDNFIADNPDDLNAAVQVILNDAGIVPAFTAGEIPDRYYAIRPAQKGFNSRDGGALLFSENPDIGETLESFNGLALPGAFTWEVLDGRLALDFTPELEPEVTLSVWPNPGQSLRCRKPNDLQFVDSCPHECADYEYAASFASTRHAVTGTELDRTYTRYAEGPGETREFASASSNFFTEFTAFTYNDGSGDQLFQFCDEFETVTRNFELLNAEKTVPKRLELDEFAGETLAITILYDPDDPLAGTAKGLFMDFVTLADGDPDGEGFRSASTQVSGISLKWRILPVDTNDDGIPDGDELQFRYAGGEIQSMRQLEDSVGLETGFFFEVTGVPVHFGVYDIFLRKNPDFSFTVPYLSNASGEYWQGTINSWNKFNWFTNQDGILELKSEQVFGWEFASDFTGANNRVDESIPMNYWALLEGDEEPPIQVGQLKPFPAGTLRINYGRNRYWIPIDDTQIDVPAELAHAPSVRQRFYVIEVESNPDGTMRVPPRINSDEIFYKSIFSWFP